MKKFIIFCPFRNDFSCPTGSNIRIQGYTEPLNELGIDFKFLAPLKPKYVTENNFISFKIPRKLKKLFIVHNVLFRSILTKPLSFFAYCIIAVLPAIKRIKKLSKEYRIISHQENSIILFLYLRFKIQSIYDIHGILEIQKEYLDDMNFWKSFWFKLELMNERMVFKNIPLINVVSPEMDSFAKSNLDFKGSSYLAPDGLLRIPEIQNEKIEQVRKEFNINKGDSIILFFGSFKKFGGVLLLTEAFIKIATEYPKTRLLLIGSGQMQKHVYRNIEDNNLSNRLIHIPFVPYDCLQNYLQISSIVVIPDLKNIYNEITPHIKLFDSLASGKMLIIPDFQVNKRVVEKFQNRIRFFEPSITESLVGEIKTALANNTCQNEIDIEDLISLLYARHSEKYFEKAGSDN